MDEQATDTSLPLPADDIQTFINKVKETIQASLEDQEIDHALRPEIEKIQDWDKWSPHAKTAYSHLLAAQLLRAKAMTIRITHALEFTDSNKSSYEDLMKSLSRNGRHPS
jgi:hypothetical protein